MRAVFLGNIALTLDDLRHAPDWLENSELAEYETVRREVVVRSERLRADCEELGFTYIEMTQDRDASFAAALKALGLWPPQAPASPDNAR